MLKDTFQFPNYGALLDGQKVLIAHCSKALSDAITDILKSQGAEVEYFSGEKTDADVLICGQLDVQKSSSDSLPEVVRQCLLDIDEAVSSCLEHMRKQQYGVIVQICEPYGRYSVPGKIIETTATAALEGYIKGIAMDNCRYHIRANCLQLPYNLVVKEWDKDMQLLRFPGTVKDVAKAVLYLASPMSAFMTGESVPLNGGGFIIGHNQNWKRKVEQL